MKKFKDLRVVGKIKNSKGKQADLIMKEEAQQIAPEIIGELCYRLDQDLYLPMKEELKDRGTHTLGFKKEKFKEIIEEVVNDLFSIEVKE